MYPQHCSACLVLGILICPPAPLLPRSRLWQSLASSRALSIAPACCSDAKAAISAKSRTNTCLIGDSCRSANRTSRAVARRLDGYGSEDYAKGSIEALPLGHLPPITARRKRNPARLIASLQLRRFKPKLFRNRQSDDLRRRAKIAQAEVLLRIVGI